MSDVALRRFIEPVTPRTLLDRLWDEHVVQPQMQDLPAILFIDLHLLNEVTSPQAFALLARRGLPVRHPERTLATIDHATPTLPPGRDGRRPYVSAAAEGQVSTLEANACRYGIKFLGWEDDRRGIVHVIGPELGATLPGSIVVCGDSHTSTHGAFGALAFGIGTSEVADVLATQTLFQRKPKSLHIRVDGELQPGVSAKDLALMIITTLGSAGGAGSVLEYGGAAIRSLGMEGRMTVCNMSIEAGARAGMVAPDETTLAWLKGRTLAPTGRAWDAAVEYWETLRTDADAEFDREIIIDASQVRPSVTWGTSPDTAMPIDGLIPHVATPDARRALSYMGLEAGKPIMGRQVDTVFIGSCTNGRLGDLHAVAAILRGRSVAPHVRLLVVPGSEQVRRDAEAAGIDRVVLAAGGEWRVPGCSMCLGMNGDVTEPGKLVVSTSNRNFIGRQGPGARSVLASPEVAAACAVAGAIADPRHFLDGRKAAL